MAVQTFVRPDPSPARPGPGGRRERNRAKRLGALTGAVFGFFALGIALAYFVSEQPYQNNSAGSGSLAVAATGLGGPMSTTGLFPTSLPEGGIWAAKKEFTITNGSKVPVEVTMTAACTNCKTTELDKQWRELWISIRQPGAGGGSQAGSQGGAPIYYGKLADMYETAPALDTDKNKPSKDGSLTPGPVSFGIFIPEGSKTYVASVWLADDPKNPQPQGLTNIWTFTIKSKTRA